MYNFQKIPGMRVNEFVDLWNNCPPGKWNVCMGKKYVSQGDCFICRLEWCWEEVEDSVDD